MPFAISKSKSETSPITATGNAVVVKGKGKVAKEGSVQVGDKGSLNTGFQLTQGKGATGDTNVTYQITNGVGEDGLSSLVNQLTAATGSQVDALAGVLKDQQSQVGELAENKQTDGDAGRNKTVVLVVLAVLALVALFIWKRKI